MKAKAVKKENDWTRPGKMTHEEFMAGIREAEKGPFMTMDELRKSLEKWDIENGYTLTSM